MFSVRVLADSKDRGEITLGEFSEQFVCTAPHKSDLEFSWRSELRRLVEGASSVALVHDPRFAWVLYREGEFCHVQQVFAADGDFRARLAARVSITEDGRPVSEWAIHLSEIEEFLSENHGSAA